MRGVAWLFTTVIVVIIVAVPVYGLLWSNHHDTVTCTVESKDRTTNTDGGSNQRLYTEQCGVLNVSDDWINGQWNSSDLYHQIDVGQTYEFETVGWRNGFLSAFPNVIRANVVAG